MMVSEDFFLNITLLLSGNVCEMSEMRSSSVCEMRSRTPKTPIFRYFL